MRYTPSSASFATTSAVLGLRPPRLVLPVVPLAVCVTSFSGGGRSSETVIALWRSDAIEADRVRFFAVLQAGQKRQDTVE